MLASAATNRDRNRNRNRNRNRAGNQIAARLVDEPTDAVASVLAEQTRSGTSIQLVAAPEGRSGTGGTISELLSERSGNVIDKLLSVVLA
jgi:hypothetical protein